MGRLQRKKSQQNKKKKGATGTTKSLYRHNLDLSKAKVPARIVGGQKPIVPFNKVISVKRKSGLRNAFDFFRESKLELKKVVWPTRKQTLGSTLVVIVIVSLAALFLGMVDMGLSGIVRALLG